MSENMFPFTIQDFEFRGLLGRGSYSIVYDVFSMKYQSEFAAKVTPIELETNRAEDLTLDVELLSLSRLNHPNIIRFYKYFLYSDNLIIILEKCVGGTMADKIQASLVKYNIPDVKKYMLEILSAIEYCHLNEIAHMDIKPNNIFIDSYNRAKIADFGLAIVLHKQQLVDTQCGSYNYVAPEILSDMLYDPKKTDIWSLGVTFYEMLTCELPWPEETPMDERVFENIILPPYLNPVFVDLIKNMLNRDPARRPSIQEVVKHKFFAPPISPTSSGHMKKIELFKKPLSSVAHNANLPLTMKSKVMTSQVVITQVTKTNIISTPAPRRALSRRNTFQAIEAPLILSDS